MKKILVLCLGSFLFLTPVTQAQPLDAPAEIVVTYDRDIVVKVTGMVCDFCAQSIQKVFKKDDAVEKIGVSLDDSEIIIDVKDGQTISDDKIKEAVTWAGYDTVEIIRK